MLTAPSVLVGGVANKVRVFQRITDWRRGPVMPSRLPLLLPTRSLISPITTDREICADADQLWSTGSGARFVLEGQNVRVLTDTLGVLQAFVQAP